MILNAEDLQDAMTAITGDFDAAFAGESPHNLTSLGLAAQVALLKMLAEMIREAHVANTDQTDVITGDANELSNVEGAIATLDAYVRSKLP